MSSDSQAPVRTFVLVPERDLGHAIAKRLREEPGIEVVGVSTDPDSDAYRIFDADPDVIVADYQSGGLQFLYSERLPPGDHRVVFFAPKSDEGCEACYQALVHGAHGIMCRPLSADEVPDAEALKKSVREGTLMRPADCPAVQRLETEEDSGVSPPY
jgi:DNA-binding NarL/FixJ family response regulator